ncbi:nuclear transport factor 2 family protein [Actinomadura verrucosospora]|uniref:SnoaL-like domain-containing protein n=1 Tax=Actinomadura verrucosospora TaxID=46165 RepID=A0A7D3ZZ93_ACTVE|nr:nuclear transport factor 2 family protein [Actinomadura verrucosospora]QKG21964.1 SnoaL-like domain-containing protein [Actinomadura verrucosospora]
MTLRTGDRVELLDLVARYALYADRRDIDAMAGLFTDDAVLVLPSAPDVLDPVRAFTGRAEITATLAVLNGIPVTFHALVGQVFDAGPEPGTATGEIACVAHHLTERDGRTSDLVWNCRYTDAYRLDGGAWRIARREQRVDSIETRPVRRRRDG